MEYSVNERAEALMGRRLTPEQEASGVIPFDMPCELGYVCPVCEYEPIVGEDTWDDRLEWSEYNGFLWCSMCNVDYPSALCYPIEPSQWTKGAIEVFLDTVEAAIWRDRRERWVEVK